jgi:hypothetical protein
METAQAQKQAVELQAIRETTEKLGTRMSTVIGESFRRLGEQITQEARKANESAKPFKPATGQAKTIGPRG